jgi:hypothetical protein
MPSNVESQGPASSTLQSPEKFHAVMRAWAIQDPVDAARLSIRPGKPARFRDSDNRVVYQSAPDPE